MCGPIATPSKRNSLIALGLVFALHSHAQGGCDAPMVLIGGSVDGTLLGCAGSDLVLDGSGSSAAEGHTISSYTWMVADDTLSTASSADIENAQPGGAWWTLIVVDDIGCTSSDSLFVSIAPPPTFADMPDTLDAICPDDTVSLIADVQPGLWIQGLNAVLGSGMPLPDDVSIPNSDTITVGLYEPTAVITSATDLGDIRVNMEHSYMGDLVIELTCPSGQSVVLHQQNGGSVYLGDANDADGFPLGLPGRGRDYHWNATTNAPTWAQATDDPLFLTPSETEGNPMLIPGTYAPVEPFTNLIGCPLSGDWVLTFMDLWGADNGYLYEWEITFAVPTEGQGSSTIAPVLGISDIDSAFWSGGNVILDPATPLEAMAAPSAAGFHTYTFSVMDDHGCTYARDVVVETLETAAPIEGNTTPAAGTASTYSTTAVGGTYNWSVWGGSLASPQGASSMTIDWSEPLGGWVMLHYEIGACSSNTFLYMETGMGIAQQNGPPVRAHPVPANDVLFVHATADARNLLLRDLSGGEVRKLPRSATSDALSVDVRDLASGTYLLEWTSSGQRSTSKVVIQH